MSVKQIKDQFAKAKDAEREGRSTQVARHIAAARKLDPELTTLDVAEGMDWSKGQARDFLGQERYVTAEPAEIPKERKAPAKKSTAKKS